MSNGVVVYFFTKGDIQAGSSRQRAFLVAEELNKRGIPSVVYSPPLILSSKMPLFQKIMAFWNYLKIFWQKIKKEDIIYLQRTIYNKRFLALIVFYKLLLRRKIIFDFDDALFLEGKYAFPMKILTRISNKVVVGSHFLKDWAQKYNKNVYLVPTSLDFDIYPRYSKIYSPGNNKEVVIGWAGSALYHYENLKLLVPVFKGLAAEGLPIKFTLIGAFSSQKVYNLFQNIKGLKVEFIDRLDWGDPEAMPKQIQGFDIGVMPLVDDEWNKGKCAFKAIEYMAGGVPAICSAVGENNYLIEDGKNGFLAKNEEEWYQKLKKLILDKNLRERLGREGQKTVKERYSFGANTPKLIKILNKL